MKRRGARVALGLGLALTGCAGPQPDVPREPPAERMNIKDVESLALPLDAYAPTREQRRAIEQAETTLVNRCLRRRGIEFEVAVPPGPPFQPNARRYGIAEEPRARAFGYSAPEITKRRPRPEPPESASRKIGSDCKRWTARKLDEGIADPTPSRTVTQLGFATLERSERDSRVRGAFARWSACMKEAGFDYPTPRAANGDGRFTDARDHRVTTREIDTAVADVRCKAKTDLIAIWAGIEAAYQRIAIAQNKPALDSARETLETRLNNAAKVNDRR